MLSTILCPSELFLRFNFTSSYFEPGPKFETSKSMPDAFDELYDEHDKEEAADSQLDVLSW